MQKIWDDPPIVITVPRQAIDSNDTESIVNQLYPLLRNVMKGREAAGRLVLSFEGFGKSPEKIWFDEVWQVAEARSFVAMLDQKFSFWGLMADLSGDTLYTIAACLCRIEVRGAQTVFNKDDLLAFGAGQLVIIDELFEKFNLPAEGKSARKEQIVEYFTKMPVSDQIR